MPGYLMQNRGTACTSLPPSGMKAHVPDSSHVTPANDSASLGSKPGQPTSQPKYIPPITKFNATCVPVFGKLSQGLQLDFKLFV